MDPTPDGCKCLLSGCEKGKCREVSQNMSERTSGLLWQVNRSNAFEISRNPWKHTDRAVYGYRLLQRCGCRAVQHAINQLEVHAQCRTTRDRTFACAK